MVVPVSGRSSVTVITVSRLLLVSVHPLGNPDGNMDRHGFILIGLRRQSCRNAVGGMLCTGLLCHGVGLMNRGKTFLHHIPVQVTFRRHGRHLCKGLLDFLFRREIPESGRSSSQYKYNRGGCGYAVKPRRKKSGLLPFAATGDGKSRCNPSQKSSRTVISAPARRLRNKPVISSFLSYSVYSLILLSTNT